MPPYTHQEDPLTISKSHDCPQARPLPTTLFVQIVQHLFFPPQKILLSIPPSITSLTQIYENQVSKKDQRVIYNELPTPHSLPTTHTRRKSPSPHPPLSSLLQKTNNHDHPHLVHKYPSTTMIKVPWNS